MAQVPYAAGTSPRSVAVGDFNGDGQLALAVTNSTGLSVLLGNGDGSFAPAVGYDVGPSPFAVAVGDVNGDGFPDLVTTNTGNNTVGVLLNDATGTSPNRAEVSRSGLPALPPADASISGQAVVQIVWADAIYPGIPVHRHPAGEADSPLRGRATPQGGEELVLLSRLKKSPDSWDDLEW